jgi:hypothetical protein
LEALLDERDHLKIQIHLAAAGSEIAPVTLKALQAELSAIERRIDQHWRSVNFSSPRQEKGG